MNETIFFIFFLFSFQIFFSSSQQKNTNIIVSNWPLWSDCQVGSSLDTLKFSNYQGFLIDIFFNSLPASYSENLTFFCYDWNSTMQLLSDVQSNTKDDAYIFLGPLPNEIYSKNDISSANNLSFSYPIYSSHLYIVKQPKFSSDIYFFYLQGFDIGLWFFLIFLLVLSSHLLWFFERSDDNKMPLKYLEGIKEAIWQTMLYAFLMGNRPIRSLPGRILISTIFVTSYILTVYFMCTTVSRMMNNYQYIQFPELKSLTAQDTIYSFEYYYEFIKFNNPSINIKNYTWGLETINDMIEKAKNESGHLLLPNVLTSIATNESCIMKKSSEYYETNFYLSFQYYNLDPNFILALNQKIIKLRTNYKYDIFYNLRFSPNNIIDQCNNINIDFSDMNGIWILFSCGLVISFISFILKYSLKRWIWVNIVNYDKIFGKKPLRRGFKKLIYEEKKLIQQALIEYFDRILIIYEAKHKEILKNLKNIVEEKRESIEIIEEKLKDINSQLDY